MRTISVLMFALAASAPLAAQEKTPALFATEKVTGQRGVIDQCNLVRITLDKEGRPKREIVLNTASEVFGHVGPHILIENRYIATRNGAVIDVEQKKIIHQEFSYGSLLGYADGKVVYRVMGGFDEDRLNAAFSFDLKTHKLDKVEKGSHWLLPGVKSPDNKRSIHQVASGGTIVLHQLDGTSKQLGEGHRVTYNKFASPHFGGLPFVWLDNERVLTQRGNGEFVVLDANGKEEKLVTIEDEKKGTLSPPVLFRDVNGRIIYGANHRYVIDVKAKSATKLTKLPVGHAFDLATELDADKLTAVFHENKEIGRWHLARASTAPELIAVAYARPGRSLGYPEGIAIWHAKTARCVTVEFDVGEIIGWTK